MTSAKRKKVFQKTQGHCAYCGKELSLGNFTVDHFRPKSKGGSGEPDNLLPCCLECNRRKADNDIEILRIALAWPNLSVRDLQSFEKVRKASRKLRFYYEKI